MGDPSCRIAVVASTLAKGAQVINRLTELKKTKSPKSLKDSNDALLTLSTDPKEPLYHPWSISNRYYTANVHFALHTTSRVYGAVFEGVPAVVVAWTKGEPFEEYMETVQKALEDHDPEVLLAVRLPAEGSGDKIENAGATQSDEGVAEDDNSSVDSTLISYGFEYIDASEPDTLEEGDSNGRESPSSDEGIPRLPRVIDALSTIMWPSMTSDVPDSKDSDTASRQSTLEAIVNRDPFAILQAFEELDSEFNFLGMGAGSMTLEEDETALYRDALGYHGNPTNSNTTNFASWTQGPTTREPLAFDNLEDVLSRFASMQTASPTELKSPSNPTSNGDNEAFGMFMDATNTKPSLGFEDDFTVYVSPPLEDNVKVLDHDFSGLHLEPSEPGSGRSSPDYTLLRSSDQTHFPNSASLYRSLGSTSDLGHISDNNS